jgi:two-component system, LytTR family, response regulator
VRTGPEGGAPAPSPAPVTVLVVDDERPARRKLRRLLEASPGIARIFEAPSGRLALEVLEEFEPDVVFLDVRMPGMDGFQVLEALGPERPPGVVFVTAFDDHAVRAFQVRAVDYLLKPYDASRFREALERARGAVVEHRTRATSPEPVPGVEPLVRAVRDALRDEGGRRILVNSRPGRKVPLELRRVVRIEADRNEAVFRTEASEYRLRIPLSELEERLDPHRFVRINRSEIVNLDRVLEVEPLDHGDARIHLDGGEVRRMTRRYRDRLDRFR